MATDSFVTVPQVGPKNIATGELTVNGQDVHVQYVAQFALELLHGYDVFHLVVANGTNEANIKDAPGQVYGYRAYNQAGYPIFVKLHNTAGVPTPGVGVIQTIGLEAGLPDKDLNPVGTPFDTGIGVSVVKGIADSDTTGVSADDLVIDIFFK